jgi:hypothetical protein
MIFQPSTRDRREHPGIAKGATSPLRELDLVIEGDPVRPRSAIDALQSKPGIAPP